MENIIRFVGYHCKIFLRGLVKVLYGAAVAGLIVLAVYGFDAVTYEDGYIAVCDFIGSVATMGVAISCMYAFGAKKKKGRFSSNG